MEVVGVDEREGEAGLTTSSDENSVYVVEIRVDAI